MPRPAGAKKGGSRTATRQMKAKTKKSTGSVNASTRAFNAFIKKQKAAGRTVSAAAQSRVLAELQASERRQVKKGRS